jgi:histidine phosphotransferase ChpT
MSAFDLKLAEMLASRLCHDLVNPIGAVANGVELLSEFCDTMQKDALDLVASSADRAMKRVAFFRVAYGSAGHDEGQSVQEVRGLAEGFLAGGKVALDWPAKPEDAATGLPRSGLKLLLAMVALAAESLPRGGKLAVSVEAPAGARVAAAGEGARIEFASDAVLTALMSGQTPDPASLEAKNVGAAYVGRLAREVGAKLAIEPGPDRVGFALRLD